MEAPVTGSMVTCPNSSGSSVHGEDGRPLGIEVIDPTSATSEDICGVFDALGPRQPSADALSPLAGA